MNKEHWNTGEAGKAKGVPKAITKNNLESSIRITRQIERYDISWCFDKFSLRKLQSDILKSAFS